MHLYNIHRVLVGIPLKTYNSVNCWKQVFFDKGKGYNKDLTA